MHCAFILTGNRACVRRPSWWVEGPAGMKVYCGIHAQHGGGPIVGLCRPSRGEAYGRIGEGRELARWTDSISRERTKGSNAMTFIATAKASVQLDENGEPIPFVLPDPGLYEAAVTKIEPFKTTDYNDRTIEVIHARIIWTITEEGEYEGATADAIFNPSLNDRAKLYPVYRAITGYTPIVGEERDLEADLIGRPCLILVEHREGSKGGKFANVANVLPPKAPKSRKRLADMSSLDDDLAGA